MRKFRRVSVHQETQDDFSTAGRCDNGLVAIRQKTEPAVLMDGRTLNVDVLRDGEIYASFEDMGKARRWLHKLGVTAPIAA